MHYELTIILGGDLDEKRRSIVIDRIKKLISEAGGSIEEEKEWGKRELAYPVKKQREGVYYFYALNLDTDRIGALSRVLENDEEVLRHMVIKSNVKSQNAKVKGEEKAEMVVKETKATKKREVGKLAIKKKGK